METVTLENLEKRIAALEAQIQEPLKLVEAFTNFQHQAIPFVETPAQE